MHEGRPGPARGHPWRDRESEKYKDAGEERFLQDELLQVWALHHLQIIGEAARGLTSGFRERTAHVPWAQIVGLRNILVHEYFGINLQQVWMALVRDLPELRTAIENLIGPLRHPPST